jgi:tetratricopeptide (TPR) repeat protein
MRSLVALVILAAAAGSALAQEKTWVGKTILVRKTGIRIGHTADDGKQVYVATLDESDYHVLAEDSGWIKVKTRQGTVGWFDKTEAVPLEEAVAYANQHIRLHSKDAGAYVFRAVAWQLQGEFDNAIKDYGNAIGLDPNDALSYNNRGNLWNTKKEYEKAIADCNEAIRLNPKNVLAYYNRSVARCGRKEYDQAIADSNEALRLDPKYVSAYYSRGWARLEKNDYDKAIADFDEVIRRDPHEDPAVYTYRALAWHSKKDYDKAIADFTEAIRLNPKNDYSFRSRGNAWRDKKAYDKAIADYNEAIRLDPKGGTAYNGAAWLLATCPDPKARNGKRAVELAKQAMNLDKKNDDVMDTLAAAYAETGNFDEAIRWQESAIEISNSDAYRRRLELYRKKQPYRQE